MNNHGDYVVTKVSKVKVGDSFDLAGETCVVTEVVRTKDTVGCVRIQANNSDRRLIMIIRRAADYMEVVPAMSKT